jgi:hypothetical protein
MDKPQNPSFFVGRVFDPAQAKMLEQALLYDPSALTTHAVVTGMTGSGKTGLCIVLLEEAALHGIPSIIVDPKGDLTNLMLHFPELSPQDFEPWLDPDQAARAGKTIPGLAQETATRWKSGLADWGLGRPDLLALQAAGRYTIYTPGSSAGQPVNIMSSFQAPAIPWDENRELLREKITSIVTAVLGLIGLTGIDPLRSREHILLSNIIETSWSQSRPLDLTELILQTQNPPFERLGAFPIDSLFPPKERLELAMLLNNFLAAPSFQTWQEGQALDVQALLYGSDGQPRQSIFYLAHLDDNERMFFTTLLYASVEAWMRSQRGTSGLRALVYFDEILGYLPPLANPPSKPIILRMLKQGRAFGVGLLLATQNPVDLDYKALSNAGTWFIGRLQTDQDKQRLLDGLQSAGGGMDVAEYNRLISGLQKRVFLMHSVSSPIPQLFQSRWTLNFLAGPLTRAQLPALKRLGEPTAGRQPAAANLQATTPVPPSPADSLRPTVPTTLAPSAGRGPAAALRQTAPVSNDSLPLPAAPPAERSTPPVPSSQAYSSTRPAPQAGLGEYFIPADLGLSQAAEAMNISLSVALEPEGIVYRPALLAQAQVRYLSSRYAFESQRQPAVLVTDLRGSLMVWEDYAWRAYRPVDLQSGPMPRARFVSPAGWLADARRVSALQKDFLDWVYRSGTIRLRANPTLKVYAGPQTTTAEFRALCSLQAHTAYQAEAARINATYDQKTTILRQKIDRDAVEVKQHKGEVNLRKKEEQAASGDIFSFLSGRKINRTAALSKRRLAEQAQADLIQIQQELSTLQDQLQALELVRQNMLQEAQDRWAKLVDDTSEIPLVPQKKDIFLELYGIAWLPNYLVKVGSDLQEIEAYTIK